LPNPSQALFLRRLRQLPIRELLRLNQFQKRIAEKEFIAPIVKPMFKVIQIGVQMLHTQLVIRSHHAALKQAPNVFDGVGVNVRRTPIPALWQTVSWRVSAPPTRS
jgi:hypothetical protein